MISLLFAAWLSGCGGVQLESVATLVTLLQVPGPATQPPGAAANPTRATGVPYSAPPGAQPPGPAAPALRPTGVPQTAPPTVQPAGPATNSPLNPPPPANPYWLPPGRYWIPPR
jgi:hypothetical protein